MRVIAKRFGVDPGTVQRISRPFDGVSAVVVCPILEAGPASALNERVISMARGSVRVARTLARIEKSSAVGSENPFRWGKNK